MIAMKLREKTECYLSVTAGKYGTRNIKVEYTAGYVLPSDVAGAAESTLPRNYELACILFAQTLMQTPGVTSERVGDISVTYASAASGVLPSAVAALIKL